ncbi:hypothetical protein EV217_4758 [Phyllobacterium myrsinacearum]|uniref:hypothetical protein n=1 Tax=Phyllobacterium myrsinacearum TaxID=28101 RepID=UPI001029C9D2|nr:hypothetical protein [Phyllobacterium myrsinacearum]RZS77396.1 hypothetical protein EV217_4758 [Phyllobacterium myrsinacearum]
MTMSQGSGRKSSSAWNTYFNNTARFIHPDRLSASFAGVLLPEGIELLRNAQRIGHNTRRLMREHFRLSALPVEPRLEACDLQLLLMPPEDVADFELRCGAMFLANSLAQIVQSAAAHQLKDALGQDLYALALANRHLAIAGEPVSDPDTLLAAMQRDGQACISTWRESMPDYVNDWFGLKYPGDDTIAPAHSGDLAKRALVIVRHPSNARADMAAA